ncbi:ABC transporter substrate-binding protein [Ramlibacter sp. AW1]|uniref:ABC transporter substrate-binding protein n=1 Tax=Ramlibacter aurantiacus TaxID=2801330 RepID=A0A936ZXI0_9BURK|nr:tripartite tricarboxylate transporter substrate-binding protein [Ramlibacter aurantiacus]MBL0422910.1 ABC transporter substrate-binding protein [Ramlibacter aurantiacus]
MTMNRRLVLQSLALSGLSAHAAQAFAQGGVLKILVGFPPSGLPDQVARALADPLGRALGVAGVVENRPGANGRIAAQAVKNAQPDGKTLLVVPASGMVHLPHVYNNLGYDPFTDFTPVAQLVENDFAIAISPKVPATTLREFIEWARQHPDQATFGSPGQGSSPHFMGVTLAKAVDAPLKHVPYRGSNFAVGDVSGGHVTAMIAASTFVANAHKAGQVRMLASTGAKRLAATPDVPTFTELGIANLHLSEGTWLMAPARTPADVVDKLGAAALAAVRSPEMMNVIKDQAQPAPLGPAQLSRLMREEYERRGAGIRAAGFSING